MEKITQNTQLVDTPGNERKCASSGVRQRKNVKDMRKLKRVKKV